MANTNSELLIGAPLADPDNAARMNVQARSIFARAHAEAWGEIRQYLENVRHTRPFAPAACANLDGFYTQAISEQYITQEALAQASAQGALVNQIWLDTKEAKIKSLLKSADQELAALAALYDFPKSFSVSH